MTVAAAPTPGAPYRVRVTIEGTTDLLFQRSAATEAPEGGDDARADLEPCVFRDEQGAVCLPGAYLRAALLAAAEFHRDPQQPAQSAAALAKAALRVETHLASLGRDTWEFVSQQWVLRWPNVSRVCRRPAFRAGWRATFELTVLAPERLGADLLRTLLVEAGQFQGVGSGRPEHGRFRVVWFEVLP